MCPEYFQNHSTIKLCVKVRKVRKNRTQQLYNADLGINGPYLILNLSTKGLMQFSKYIEKNSTRNLNI